MSKLPQAVQSVTCGGCGEAIRPDPLTGTTCACARAVPSVNPHLESALAKLRSPFWGVVLNDDEAAALLDLLTDLAFQHKDSNKFDRARESLATELRRE